MIFISFRRQSIHLNLGLSLLLFAGGIASSVRLHTLCCSLLFTCPYHLSWDVLHLTLMASTSTLSNKSSFLTWSILVKPHAHLHIFISATCSFFTWLLVTGTVSMTYNMAGCTTNLYIFPSPLVVFSCHRGLLTSSSSFSTLIVSCGLLRLLCLHLFV